MNISGPIRKLIQDNAAAYALLSDRVYPIVSLQDSAFPNVAVRRKGGRESANHDKGSDVDLVVAHIIINAATASSAYTVDNAATFAPFDAANYVLDKSHNRARIYAPDGWDMPSAWQIKVSYSAG